MTEMVWTKTKPDRPGLWPMRGVEVGAGVWDVSRITDVDCVLYCRIPWTGSRIPLAGTKYEWSSEPIPEPSEPPEHPDIQRLRKFADELEGSCVVLPAGRVLLRAIADNLQAELVALGIACSVKDRRP